jgi:hypothetical protein
MPFAARADVTEVGGVKYENAVTGRNAKLQLNGAGIRYKYVVKVYTAGLYLPAKATTPEGRVRRQRPAALPHRDAARDQLPTSSASSSRAAWSRTLARGVRQGHPRVIRMSEMFSMRKRLLPGEGFTIDYLPGSGRSSHQRQRVPSRSRSRSSTTPDEDLARQVAGRSQLKDALLGKNAAKIRSTRARSRRDGPRTRRIDATHRSPWL